MALTNKWVGYLDRGYTQIKQSILNRVRVNVPEITDYSESNIFVIITSILAGLVEQLNYYIDQLLRESFIVTARRYTSVVRHSRMFDYRIKAANPASTIITIEFLKNGAPYVLQNGQNETIPQGTLFNASGLQFVSTKTIMAGPGGGSMNIPVSQFNHNEDYFNTISTDPNQSYGLGLSYVHNSLSLLVNNTQWEQVTSFGKSSGTDKHFIVDIGIDGKAYIIFGDGLRGAIPPLNANVAIYYKTTGGILGNLAPGSIKSPPAIVWAFIDDVKVNQYNAATGGAGYEDIESIRKNVPLSLRTLERAVTKRDYVDVALLHPGVNKAYVKFDCGKYVDLYISPKGGGISQEPLLDSVKDWFETYRMVTTFIRPLPAGEAQIFLELDVVGRFRAKASAIESQVRDILLKNYDYENSNINKSIRKSDIYAFADNQPLVDYLTIKKMYLIPYAFPLKHIITLNFNLEMLINEDIRQYTIICMGGSTFQLQKDFVLESELFTGVPYNNGAMKIIILPGGYIAGMMWNVTIYPINKDIVIDDSSIPILKTENLIINTQEVISI
jgi:hypothetical protein